MENFGGELETKKGPNKIMLGALLVGALVVGGALWGLSRIPTRQEQKSQILDGAYREGSPEFQTLTKRIVVDPIEATQATTPLGAIVMTARGKIMNNSEKAIVALEVKVVIVDEKKNPVKEKAVVVIPNEKFSRFEPKQEVDVSVTVDGFKETDDRADIRWKVTAIKVE